MFILPMGSCRIDLPCDKLSIPRTQIGGRYSSSDHVQGLEILRREKIVPPKLRPNVFFGNPSPDRYEILANLENQKIDRVIIEICRIRSYITEGWIVMNHAGTGYSGSLPKLTDVENVLEDRSTTFRNLSTLRERLGPDCRMLLVCPATCFGFHVFYTIADILSDWTSRNRQTFFDPALLVAKYGRAICFLQGGKDYYHYTDFMQERVAEIFQEWITDPDKNIANTWKDSIQ